MTHPIGERDLVDGFKKADGAGVLGAGFMLAGRRTSRTTPLGQFLTASTS